MMTRILLAFVSTCADLIVYHQYFRTPDNASFQMRGINTSHGRDLAYDYGMLKIIPINLFVYRYHPERNIMIYHGDTRNYI
jgi:hypothetical protein